MKTQNQMETRMWADQKNTITWLRGYCMNTENTVTFEEFNNDDIKKSQLRDPNVGPIVRWFSSSPDRPEWEDVSS